MLNEKSKKYPEDEKHMLKAIVNAYKGADEEMKEWAVREISARTRTMVQSIIDKKFSAYKENYYLEMAQEGSCAVINNIGKFNPDKETLAEYFIPYITKAIDNCILKIIVDSYNTGDKKMRAWAIQEMTSRIKGFIGHMIDKHFSAYKGEYYDDLFSEGFVAVVEEMGRFNPEKGTLTTYFTPYILHKLSNYIDNEINRSTPYYSNIMKSIKEAIKYFEALHVVPTLSDIALHTGLSVKKVEDGLQRIQATNEQYYETDADLDAMVTQTFEGPEQELIKKERTEVLRDAILELDKKDRVILGMRFGIDDGCQKSFATIAKELHIPSNQVMNSINRSLRILGSNYELRRLEGAEHEFRRRKTLRNTEMSKLPDSGMIQLYDDFDDYEVEVNINIRKKSDEEDGPIILSV